MERIWMLIICFTFITYAYSDSDECVKSRTWQIGNTMYANVWNYGKLYVHATCNETSLSLNGSTSNLCRNGELLHSLPQCLQSGKYYNCNFGNKWQVGVTKYEVVRRGENKFVRAKCIQESFIIDRDALLTPCDNYVWNQYLPNCRKGEVRNHSEACATGRRSRSENYNFENVWKNGELYVRAFCFYGESEERIDTILCKDGKMQSPICERRENNNDICVPGKKWNTRDTEYEIYTYGKSFMVIGKCKIQGLQMVPSPWKMCEGGMIPKVLPQCKAIPLSYVNEANSSTAAGKSINPFNINKCIFKNGGCNQICKTENGAIECSCNKGYELQSDNKTCVDINECSSNHFNKCEHQCKNTNGSYTCSCNHGYILFTEFRCKDIDECANNATNKCDHRCHNIDGSYECSCHPGYVLINDFKCEGCRKNSYRSGLNTSCVDCPLNSHTDSDSKRSLADCICNSGFYGNISNEEPCRDINECASENFGCSHFCINRPGYAVCTCPKGFKLKPDRKRCADINECSSNQLNKCEHQCKNTNGSYTCFCNHGYILFNEFRCKDINECLTEKFGCSDECVNTHGSAYCSCSGGFTLQSDGKHCRDIDECANNATNKCDHQCHNIDGSYECSCHPGYVLINDFKCEGCRKNSYRSSLDTFCVDCPLNSHTDSDSKRSLADCICNSGFYGNISNDEPCRDINECDSSNFGCSDSCINTIGSAHCSCLVGYQLLKDQKTCSDIDECQVKNGGCQGICKNSNGSFRCTCKEGYAVSITDSYICDDVNECLESNGGCSGDCTNFLGGYHCSCPEDSFLAEDDKTCLTLYCPEAPIPYHSRLVCFPKANKLAKSVYLSENATYSEKLPVGTICKVKCNKGYAIEESSSVISCQKNGIWNDTLEECKVSQCPVLNSPENGDVYPPQCKEGLMAVKEKCYFTCNEGYSMKGNRTIFTCRNKLQWNYDAIPSCEPIHISPYVTCPSDVVIDLLPDQNASVIFLKYPKTNVEDVQVVPDWVEFERNVSFPAGKTDVLLVANSRNFKYLSANCTFSVIVIDNQLPEFLYCPEMIGVIGSNVGGAVVYWEEPTAVDNVGIKSVTKSAEPNSTWFPGLHIVEYIAEDFAGNIARCSFEINITRGECGDLKDPENGYANCHDWVYGKVCEPICHTNYTRGQNDDVRYYFCDDIGVWTPSDVISLCLPECQSEEIWSLELETCVNIAETTTDIISV